MSAMIFLPHTTMAPEVPLQALLTLSAAPRVGVSDLLHVDLVCLDSKSADAFISCNLN